MAEVWAAWGMIAAFWTVVLGIYWLVTEIQDRLHSKRMVKMFDEFVESLRGEKDDA